MKHIWTRLLRPDLLMALSISLFSRSASLICAVTRARNSSKLERRCGSSRLSWAHRLRTSLGLTAHRRSHETQVGESGTEEKSNLRTDASAEGHNLIPAWSVVVWKTALSSPHRAQGRLIGLWGWGRLLDPWSTRNPFKYLLPEKHCVFASELCTKKLKENIKIPVSGFRLCELTPLWFENAH